MKKKISYLNPLSASVAQRPRVVDLLFTVTRAHQKIQALFSRGNFNYCEKLC